MTMAARVAPVAAPCPPEAHRHTLTCARCGVSDQTVAQTIVRNGVPWPATCASCSADIREKSNRIAALERIERA